ncbi:hypothetical protein ACLBX9_31480 [Methylobacterium sp. A49B]|uniref:Uncharacterized protein n=1 Tax=Methylobacterium mesophilicum SR1.6/6 TaxID=908290 RepID=A0A6B9FS87_9HYPH|nr:hypothetical protein [Methylobacterium mesophilicum]QGY03825.1 hypothetical protein MMSR116_19440 [Methylobacterium mesophilicum SR1.6/6]
MTDAGGSDLKKAAADERERLLGEIAGALNIPVMAFRSRVSWADGATGPSASECAALLAAFSRIADPERRSACLALVEGFGESSDCGVAVRPRTSDP